MKPTCDIFMTVDLDGVALEVGEGVEPVGRHSCGRYAYDAGVPRYLRLFAHHGVTATFFISGYDAEVRPDVVRAIHAQGHEVAAHGYKHESVYVDGDEELSLLTRTHELLTAITGEQPSGWRNPGGLKSHDTHRSLQRLGYVYDSSDKDQEEPYSFRVADGDGGSLVELPTNTSTLDDGYLNPVAMPAPSELERNWALEFDLAYREIGYYPLILHGRAHWGTGTPARIRALDGLIRHISSHERVRWRTGRELAEEVRGARPGNRTTAVRSEPPKPPPAPRWRDAHEVAWPDGGRCCVAIAVEVDGESVDMGNTPHGNLWGRYSHGRFALQVGVRRMADMLAARGARATFFVPGWDAEQAPDAVRHVADCGHEVAAHGYMHEDHSGLGAATRDTLERAHDALERCTGRAPVGWRAPDGLMSLETHEHLRRLGYVYDASAMDSDLPYAITTLAGELVEIPQFPLLRDVPYYQQFRSADSVLQTWREEFDAIYADGLLFNLTVTCRGDVGSARGVRLQRLDELLAYMTSLPGVHVATHAELAGWSAGRAPAAPMDREVA